MTMFFARGSAPRTIAGSSYGVLREKEKKRSESISHGGEVEREKGTGYVDGVCGQQLTTEDKKKKRGSAQDPPG